MADHSSSRRPAHGPDVVEAARLWLGTPYHHQQSVQGVGCDCLGLVRGVWRTLVGEEPETPPAYSPDWAEATGRDTLADACARLLIARDHLSEGAVILFRMTRAGPAKHCGIMTARDRFIHAREGIGVIEQNLADFLSGVRTARIVGAFSFPGR